MVSAFYFRLAEMISSTFHTVISAKEITSHASRRALVLTQYSGAKEYSDLAAGANH